jgi:hypothetical protein
MRPRRDAPALLLSGFSMELEARIWFAAPQRRYLRAMKTRPCAPGKINAPPRLTSQNISPAPFRLSGRYCIRFLRQFDTIFTLNYDLLLYWVILEKPGLFQDGFGLGQKKSGFHGPFEENARCKIYNLHGGLHLFQTSTDEVEKIIRSPKGMIHALLRPL